MFVSNEQFTIVGLDIGGTKIHGILMDIESNEVIKELKVDTQANKGIDEVIKQICFVVNELKEETTVTVGLGIAGPLDHIEGIIYQSPNLPGCKNVPIKDMLQAEFDLPVLVDNDAKCFALAECLEGAGKGVENAVAITLGTGIGGGIVLGGTLLRGRNNTAGEFGHMTIVASGYQCNCGNHGCWERYASGTAILERTRKSLGEGGLQTGLTAESLSIENILSAYHDDDLLAKDIVFSTARYLGVGIANIVNMLNPDVVVLGGSVTNSLDLLEARMRETIKERSISPSNEIPVLKATLENPGTLGAALVAKQGFLSQQT